MTKRKYARMSTGGRMPRRLQPAPVPSPPTLTPEPTPPTRSPEPSRRANSEEEESNQSQSENPEGSERPTPEQNASRRSEGATPEGNARRLPEAVLLRIFGHLPSLPFHTDRLRLALVCRDWQQLSRQVVWPRLRLHPGLFAGFEERAADATTLECNHMVEHLTIVLPAFHGLPQGLPSFSTDRFPNILGFRYESISWPQWSRLRFPEHRQPAASRLPPHVLAQIFSLLPLTHCSSDRLNVGLVCRAWRRPALDLTWTHLNVNKAQLSQMLADSKEVLFFTGMVQTITLWTSTGVSRFILDSLQLFPGLQTVNIQIPTTPERASTSDSSMGPSPLPTNYLAQRTKGRLLARPPGTHLPSSSPELSHRSPTPGPSNLRSLRPTKQTSIHLTSSPEQSPRTPTPGPSHLRSAQPELMTILLTSSPDQLERFPTPGPSWFRSPHLAQHTEASSPEFDRPPTPGPARFPPMEPEPAPFLPSSSPIHPAQSAGPSPDQSEQQSLPPSYSPGGSARSPAPIRPEPPALPQPEPPSRLPSYSPGGRRRPLHEQLRPPSYHSDDFELDTFFRQQPPSGRLDIFPRPQQSHHPSPATAPGPSRHPYAPSTGAHPHRPFLPTNVSHPQHVAQGPSRLPYAPPPASRPHQPTSASQPRPPQPSTSEAMGFPGQGLSIWDLPSFRRGVPRKRLANPEVSEQPSKRRRDNAVPQQVDAPVAGPSQPSNIPISDRRSPSVVVVIPPLPSVAPAPMTRARTRHQDLPRRVTQSTAPGPPPKPKNTRKSSDTAATKAQKKHKHPSAPEAGPSQSNKVRCKYCGKLLMPRSMKRHLDTQHPDDFVAADSSD